MVRLGPVFETSISPLISLINSPFCSFQNEEFFAKSSYTFNTKSEHMKKIFNFDHVLENDFKINIFFKKLLPGEYSHFKVLL